MWFWKEHVSGKKLIFEGNMFPGELFLEEHVSGKLVLDRTPPGGSYLYMSLEVIRETYLLSILSGRTLNMEASGKTSSK